MLLSSRVTWGPKTHASGRKNATFTQDLTAMKRVIKTIVLVLGAFVASVLLYFGAAFVLSRMGVEREEPVSEEVTLYILTNGVHTDIVVPVRNAWMDWREVIPYANTVARDTLRQYLAMGWGDRGFYLETPTWADLKFSTAFKAATGLSRSAIHATFYRTIKEGDDCRSFTVSHEQYARLVTYITSTLKTDANGHALYIDTDANYGKHDAFYEANGSYNVFYTCNTWANNALKSCGQKACWWTPFDKGIFYQYRP